MSGIDSSIYRQFAQPVKSVQDYDNERMQGQQNQLALALQQQKADEYTRGVESANRLRGAVSGFGTDRAANQQALTNIGALDEAEKYGKGTREAAKADLETKKAQIESHMKKFELSGQIMAGVRDQTTWDQARAQTAQLFGPEAAAQMPAAYDPQLVESKRQQAMPVKEQLAAQHQKIADQLAADKFAYDKTNDAANRSVQIRGQNQTASTAAARLSYDKAKEAGSEDSALGPMATRMIAQQYLAGDSGALGNIGRGTQGAKNLTSVRNEVARQANVAGMNGADIAAKMAEYQGMRAGNRTLGTRTANIEVAAAEAAELAPLALEASRNVTRSGFLPFGKAQIMFDANTNDPALREFAMANNALVTAFGQVMSRGGAATVSDKDHARELLSTAFDQPSYERAIRQLEKEIKAAQRAPGKVRKEMSAAASGRTGEHDAPAAGGVVNFGDLK